MVPDNIEREARAIESEARRWLHLAAHDLDDVERHRTLADIAETCAVDNQARAAGLAFRAAELRYDARGGMTAALERRRFEPGARWSIDGETCDVACRDANGLRVDSDRWTDGFFVRASEMTRANGWLFLGLSDQGGYR